MTGSEALRAVDAWRECMQQAQRIGERMEAADVASMALALRTARDAMKAALGGDLRPETRKRVASAIRMAEAELGLEAA